MSQTSPVFGVLLYQPHYNLIQYISVGTYGRCFIQSDLPVKLKLIKAQSWPVQG